MLNISLRLLLCACFLWVLPPVEARAQQASRDQVLSAYIYNFAKNIQWRNEDAISTFHFHVVSENQNLVREMTQMSRGRFLRSKPIRITSSTTAQGIENAHLVFAARDKENLLASIVDEIEGKNILLVTEEYRDKRLIMINLIGSESGSLRFEINKANLVNQHLKVMEDVILLGGTEVDVATLYREGQQSLRALQKRMLALESDLASLERDIAVRTREIAIQKDSLLAQSQRILDQESTLRHQRGELTTRENNLAAMVKKLKELSHTFEHKTRELEKQNTELQQGRKALEILKGEIRKQEDVLQNQSRELEEKGLTITRQQSYLNLLGVIVFLSLLLVIVVYVSYTGKKKLTRQLEAKVSERTNDLQSANARLMIELDEKLMAEEALQQSEQQYRFLFERSPLPMLVYDQSGLQLLAVNTAFSLHYGFSKEEALTLSLPDLYPEEEKKSIAELAKKLHGHAYAGEWHHLKKDGSLISIEAYSRDMAYEGRTARIAVLTDITERKRAEEELRIYRVHLEDRVRERTAELHLANEQLGAIFDATNVGIVMMKDRMILQCNKRLEEIFGYEAGELKGQSARLWYQSDEEFTRVGTPVAEQIMRGETHQREQLLVKKNGENFMARITAKALDPAAPGKGLVGVIEDVTMERQNEESLRRALEAAKAADQLKSAFLATMSHELRTPLNSIIGFTGILMKELAGPLNAEQHKQLGMAKGSAQHLLALINDVLDISKIEAGQMVVSIQPMDLAEVLRKAADTVKPLAEKKHLELHVEIPEGEVLIHSDERKMGQVFLNLLNNAIKFTDHGSVSVELVPSESSVLVRVIDTGIGIRGEDRDKLFKPFSQIDTGLTRNHEGTGLGLSISKRLVEKLGGVISVQSAEGEGSIFSVTMPITMNTQMSGEGI